MRLFELHRDVDSSGVSGTGIVAQGVEFDNGQCAMSWLCQWQSVAIYPDISTLEAIHGHNGNTRVVWLEDERSYTIETWENGPVAKVVDKLDP
jgi:hypothetical protein